MRTTKNCTEKIRETRETHQSDCAEAVKYLRDAADVLEGGGEAQGEEKERRGQHVKCEKINQNKRAQLKNKINNSLTKRTKSSSSSARNTVHSARARGASLRARANRAQSTSIVVSENKFENNYAHLKKSTTTNKTSEQNEPNSSWQLRKYTNMSRGTHLALARKNENLNFWR